MATATEQQPQPLNLPLVGQSRWNQIKPFLPVSRATWTRLCNTGKAPQPVRLTHRCTVYSNVEIHKWIADPAGYTPV
jgi:prophage regulatory protein